MIQDEMIQELIQQAMDSLANEGYVLSVTETRNKVIVAVVMRHPQTEHQIAIAIREY